MTEFLTDFGLRDWLLVLGPVFIVGILIHGYWRMRNNRHNLKMSLDKSFITAPGENPDTDDFTFLKAELPNGGARVRTQGEQTALNLKEDVPVLMDPVADDGIESAPVVRATRSSNSTKSSAAAPVKASEKASERAREKPRDQIPEKFVVLYTVAIDAPFEGQALLETLVEQGMKFGEMDIFHRIQEDGQSAFSLVNALEPGSFEIKSMADLQTPAVSLFMRAHELKNPVEVFDDMLSVGQRIAEDLGGELRDETKSVVTPQTIEHLRSDLREFMLKHKLS